MPFYRVEGLRIQHYFYNRIAVDNQRSEMLHTSSMKKAFMLTLEWVAGIKAIGEQMC